MSTEIEEFDIDLEMELDLGEPIEQSSMEKFYAKEFFFSNSSLKLLLSNPPAFQEKYINNVYEERLDKHLINGKLIHCLLLQPDMFDDNFILSPIATPTGKGRTVLHNVLKEHVRRKNPNTKMLTDYEDVLLQELANADLHQSLVDDKKIPTLTGDRKRLDKMLTDENISYFDYMMIRGKKNVVDQAALDFCNDSVQVIVNDPYLSELLGLTGGDPTDEIINEQMYYGELDNRPFGIKGIPDNIKISHSKKIIYINDFKTTGKELFEFRWAIEPFAYDSQAAMYMLLIFQNFQNLIDEGYTIEFRFITIDKNLQAYAFKVTESTMQQWAEKLDTKFLHAEFHYNNKSYGLPYYFANQLVEL